MYILCFNSSNVVNVSVRFVIEASCKTCKLRGKTPLDIKSKYCADMSRRTTYFVAACCKLLMI